MTFEFRNVFTESDYKESSAVTVHRFDGSANTGSLFEMMRDTVVSFDTPNDVNAFHLSPTFTIEREVQATFRQK